MPFWIPAAIIYIVSVLAILWFLGALIDGSVSDISSADTGGNNQEGEQAIQLNIAKPSLVLCMPYVVMIFILIGSPGTNSHLGPFLLIAPLMLLPVCYLLVRVYRKKLIELYIKKKLVRYYMMGILASATSSFLTILSLPLAFVALRALM